MYQVYIQHLEISNEENCCPLCERSFTTVLESKNLILKAFTINFILLIKNSLIKRWKNKNVKKKIV